MLLFICLLAFIINGIEDYRTIKIPFRESMDLFNIPMITLKNNGLKLRFMIDTGSDNSYLSLEAKKLIEEKGSILDKIKTKYTIVTGNGEVNTEEDLLLSLKYDNKEFIESFSCIDIGNNFKVFKGVELHGILGSKFFKKYKYQIDFNKLHIKYKSWTKKK